MHFSRKLILLAAFMVGLGFVGSGEVRAAALVESVAITTPDSGALLGIDGTFQVRVVVEDFLEGTDLQIAIFLAQRTATSPVAYVPFADADPQLPAADIPTDITLTAGATDPLGLAAFSEPLEIATDVGVVVTKGSNEDGTKIIFDRADDTTTGADETQAVDGDSLVLESSNNKQSVFVWYGKVHFSSGNSTAGPTPPPGPIFAAALVFDDSDDETSPVVFSKNTISIDAVRTVTPNNLEFSNAPAARVFSTDQTAAGFSYIGVEDTTVTDPDGTPGSGDETYTADGTYKDVGGSVVKVSRIGTANSNSDHGVLGIGDTLKLDVTLGAASPVLGGRDDDYQKIILDIFGKERLIYQRDVMETSREGGVLKYNLVLEEGDFDDFSESRIYDSDGDATNGVDGVTDTLQLFVVDKAGNRSKASTATTDETAAGATAITKLLFDAKRPVLDSTNGDTILPVTVDTISDGSRNADGRRIKADENQMEYELAHTLDSLVIAFDGENDKSFAIEQSGLSINSARALRAENTYYVDFTQLGIKDAVAGKDTVWVTEKNPPSGQKPWEVELETAKDEIGLKTGMHTIKFTGTDVAGNVGGTLTRENVYVDVDNIDFVRSFPFGSGDEESGLDTIEAGTAQVVFRLSEAADSVSIEYKGIATGADADSNEVGKSRAYQLVGGQLANTTGSQKFRIRLYHDNQYVLQVAARDLAGNWFESVADTFWYNEDFQVPQASKFDVEITKPVPNTGTYDAAKNTGLDKVKAGDEIGIKLTVKSVDDKVAPTYDKPATITVDGGSGISLKADASTGASVNGDGTISLNGEDWIIGMRSIVFMDSVSVENLTISIEADDDSTIVGEADSVIVVNPAAYSKILVSVPESVRQGDEFTVGVVLADKFGNQVKDSRFVAVSTNMLGVQVPPDAVYIKDGTGSFPARSSATGDLGISVRDVADGGPAAPGTGSVTVMASGGVVDPSEAPAPPNGLIGEDYAGAGGDGDQGGFVMLTWGISDDHNTLDKYRIYREVSVTTGLDSAGNIVSLEEPTMAPVTWGTVDAIPGADIMRVVVATLDSDASRYAVAAERSGQSAFKQAFGVGQSVSNPYEMMARTMVRSMEAAKPASDAPVFATLSPEALAFQEKGVAPLFKEVQNAAVLSTLVYSEGPVRAIDNIPPSAVPYLKVLDTPGDAGGSIRVAWTLSPDDRLLRTIVGNAVGGSIFEVAGVKEYNIYRKIGDAAYGLVGQVGGGVNVFDDPTVFNGVRYTYEVRPADVDNETAAEFEGTAMAIRNRVLDAGGNVVLGLFGSDNEVGFDDFFILADQFGLTAEDENFEPAFDLSPNNRIDLNDFFTFADFFGRTVEGAGKALPVSMAGLNSDARFYLDAGTELPGVGEEMAIRVSLQDFVELKAYGLSVSYDPQVLAYVGARVENGILGAGEFAEGQLVSQKDGLLSLAAYGDVATEGDLGLNLVFRSLREIEDSYIDIVDAQVRDDSYRLNSLATPVSVRIQTRPEVYALRNNYPNPFNPETTLKYDLPEAGDVKLEVYNMLGQVVSTLVNEHQAAGRYAIQWDATNDRGRSMSSGVYFYRVQVGDQFTDIKKMLLLK